MYISPMRPPKYLGVYSQPLAKADGTRKTLFFAWDLAEQGYAVQQLDNAFQPKAEARRVSAAILPRSSGPSPPSWPCP